MGMKMLLAHWHQEKDFKDEEEGFDSEIIE